MAHGRDVPYHPLAGGRDERPSIVLVLGDENLGYAGGNNLGIRVALQDGCDQVWLLNNDTVVATDSLAQLLTVLQTTPAVGIVGACILEYGTSDVVQCLGGYRYSSLTTARKAVGAGLTYAAVQALPQSERRLDYVSGASMLIPATTLRRVGLLAEEYFLYHEDVDYACRCGAAGLPLVVSSQARVYHKFGGTAGSSETLEGKSALAAFHGARSTMILTRKYRPYLVPVTLVVRLLWVAYLALNTAGRRLVRPTVRGLIAGLQARGSSTA